MAPRRTLIIAVTVAALAATASVNAQKSARQIPPSDADRVCGQVADNPPAPPPYAHPLSETELAACDSKALYYGFGRPADPVAALQCAHYEREHSRHPGMFFVGPGVLSMLYANGKGADRDYDLAIRYACEITFPAGAERELRLTHLQALKNAHATTSTFDLCDDITSGAMMGICEEISQRQLDVGRQQKLDRIARGLTPAARASFGALRKAEQIFEDTRVGHEIDMSGTARGMFVELDGGLLRDQFLINLQRFAAGDIPRTTDAGYQAIDAKLNAMFKQIEEAPADAWKWGTIKQDGIIETERAWLALRDAWEKFGRLAYPKLTRAALLAQLDRLRIDQLKRLLPSQDPVGKPFDN